MLIVDAHLDLAWNALQWNRDLLQSVYTTRTREVGTAGKGRAQGTVALPELRQGQVALCFATVLARSTGVPVPYLDYGSPSQAYAVGHGQLAYYHALEQSGHVRVIADVHALDAHIAEWQSWEASTAAGDQAAPPLGFVISMEGADPILDSKDTQTWWDAGLRIVGLSHYGPGRYAGGTGTEHGLSELGVALLEAMDRLGMILDLTHCSDQAFWQALDRWQGPVLASHNNCRALVPHQRQFGDNQLQALIQRDGVIGAACDAWMLQPGWQHGVSTNDNITLSSVADQIDHVCQLAGSSRHAAIGSDLDGGFGREQSPSDLDTIADLQKLDHLLAQRGYSTEDIANIMHGNWVRVLRAAWSRAA